jgi:hypothetical protein
MTSQEAATLPDHPYCGEKPHKHGPACHSKCPTCHAKYWQEPIDSDQVWEPVIQRQQWEGLFGRYTGYAAGAQRGDGIRWITQSALNGKNVINKPHTESRARAAAIALAKQMNSPYVPPVESPIIKVT